MPSALVHQRSIKSKDSGNYSGFSMEALTLDSVVAKSPLMMKASPQYKKVNFDPADTAKVQKEMYTALKARRDALEELLRKRTEDLKLLCIKEGELTGRLPAEIPLAPGEEPPQIRRRVGTAFSLDSHMVSKDDQAEDSSKKLELELELQKQITNAAHKLASDKSVSRFVRKQRRHSFIKAQNKLKEMEKKLSDYRKCGDIPASPASSVKYDGMYRVTATASTETPPPFNDESVIHRHPKSRHSTSVAHRLSRSFRERNLLKYHKFIDSGKNVKSDRNSSVLTESSFDDSRTGSMVHESRLDESRLADSSFDVAEGSEESYKLSNDSLYPSSSTSSHSSHSSHKYVPGASPLDLSFLTPPPVPKRREIKIHPMSPNTRRSKRASWHHTMFPKMSPQIPRANKETAV